MVVTRCDPLPWYAGPLVPLVRRWNLEKGKALQAGTWKLVCT